MEPHWGLQLIIGAILGLSLPYVAKFIIWPFKRFQYHVLKRDWWHYYYSETNGEYKIFESSFKIKTGFFSNLVYLENQQNTNLKYEGKIIIENGTSQFVALGNSVFIAMMKIQ